jgi:hypothetical protein
MFILLCALSHFWITCNTQYIVDAVEIIVSLYHLGTTRKESIPVQYRCYFGFFYYLGCVVDWIQECRTWGHGGHLLDLWHFPALPRM